jgi:transmembrane sensor
MSARSKSDESIRDQAAAWTNLLDNGGMSDSQRQAFHAWLEDPRNEREFAACQAVVSLAQDFPPERKAALERSIVIPAAMFAALRRLLAHPLQLSGVLATLVIVMGGAWFGLRPVREFFTHSYTTEIGEMRTVVLQDGTIAHLNTQSRLTWIGTGADRRVVLQQGEVLLDVVHDAQRPFRLLVDRSEIRDLGTRFDVYRKSSGNVVVTVISGTVAVDGIETGSAHGEWKATLTTDHQVEYTPFGPIEKPHSIVANQAITWRDGVLVTGGEYFPNVVSELSRYTSKRILIADWRLNSLKIGGAFSIRDVRAALALIQKTQPILITDTADAYILSYKGAGPVSSRPEAARPNEAGHP